MNPKFLIPTPDPLQVQPFWFQLLLILTFYIHLILMNTMLGISIIAFWENIRGKCDNKQICKDISKTLPFLIGFTVNFGVAPLLFLQNIYGHFMFTSSILMGVFWLSVIILLIISYYAAYIFKMRYDEIYPFRSIIIGISTIGMASIAFIICNNITMMERPESWIRYFDNPSGLLLNLSDPTLAPRYLHFLLSAIAIGGLSIALFYKFRYQRGYTSAYNKIGYGCKIFSLTTIVNFAVGFWFLESLHPLNKGITTPIGLFFTISLFTGITTGLLAIYNGLQERVIPTLYWAMVTIFFMVLVRDFVRAIHLGPYFHLSEFTINPQYSPLIIFLICFLCGIILIGWMAKCAFKATELKGGRP
ncbi:MAG: hypothetical protein OEM02_08025 [Desulfobulbaceae bacterium]|nr:hypothetical protein [Desulfobulbaceae bacterium]